MSNAKKKIGSFVTLYEKAFVFANKSGLLITAFLALTMGVLVSYGFYYLAIADWRASNDSRETAVIEIEKQNVHNQALIKLMPPFLGEFRKMIADFRDVEPLIPSESELAQVLFQVQEAASRNNVRLTGLNAVKQSVKMSGQPEGREYINEREFPSQVAGAYPDIVHFFNDVAMMPRILVVRDYSIVALKDGKTNANFTLVAYHATGGELPAIPKEVIQNSDQEITNNVEK